MLARLLDALIRTLASPRGFHLCVAGLALVLLLLRAFLFAAAERDDAEQILFAQTWAWGYAPGKAPLYTWLVILSQSLFGVGVFAVEAVKFALIALLYVLLYRGARRVLRDERLAALAGLSPLALYIVAWDATLNYSHTVLLLSVCVATFTALLRLERRQGWADYGLLGALLGLGLLAKYNYGLFAAALALAALADPVLRPRLLSVRSVLALAVALAIVAPHGAWALAESETIGIAVVSKLSAPEALGPLEGRLRALYELIKAAFNFASPFVFLLPLLFWRSLAPIRGQKDGRHRRLLGRHLLILGALAAAGALGFGASELRSHYLAVFILFPLYAFARVEVCGARPWAIRAYAGFVAACALAVVTALAASALIGPRTCDKCRLHLDYEVLADAVRAAGFADGTIAASFHRQAIAGNLRLEFPDARVTSTEYPRFQPPRDEGAGSCLLVWQPEEETRYGVDMRAFALVFLEARIPAAAPVRTVDVPLAGNPGRSVEFAYLLWPEGAGRCR